MLNIQSRRKIAAFPARRGFSMVEVLVGTMVLASTSMLLSSSLSSSQSQMNASKNITHSAAIASQQIEWYLTMPQTLSVPDTLSTPQVNTALQNIMTTPRIVSLPDFLDANNSEVLPTVTSMLDSSERDFFYDKEVEVRLSVLGDPSAPSGGDTGKLQVSVYEKDPSNNARGRLIYTAAQLGWRLDPRSR